MRSGQPISWQLKLNKKNCYKTYLQFLLPTFIPSVGEIKVAVNAGYKPARETKTGKKNL